nr:DNA-directed RNA polymerase III subunit 1-like isoform X1 [Ipomoea batatas]
MRHFWLPSAFSVHASELYTPDFRPEIFVSGKDILAKSLDIKNYACRYWCLLLSANLFLYSCNKVFLETCISRYHEKKLEDGTSIGAIGAQSIGEPGTQMTLKTFHFAGVASMSILVSIGVGVCSNLDDVTLGVPRIKEIINAAKRISTPIIEAKLSCDDNQKFARIVKGRIEKTLLGQVAKSIKIVMAARVASIVIVLDLEAILTSCLSIDAYIVKESILQTKKIKLKEQHIKVLDPKKLEIIPHADRSKLHFELHRLKNKLPGVVVKGINTVERAVINKDEKEKEMGKEKYNLLVEGTGLLAVMGTDGVVGCNTKTNHIMEVNQVLGIEAARKGIIGEIKYIMKQHGMTIDVRHMMLLADLMTFKGEVLGITRFGIQKMKDSVLTLASFEKTADHLFNASVSGRDDKIEGVGECIIMGIPMQMGTGMLKVMQSNTSHPIELNYGKESIIPRD